MRLRCSARTDVGLAREHNEDSYGVGSDDQIERIGKLLVVCDGMGGHAAGEVASRIGVDTILERYTSDINSDRDLVLRDAIEAANEAIFRQGRGTMGTTGVAALLFHSHATIANVGDSRAYMLRGNTIRQISRDHSLVSDQVAAGLITPEQARTSHHRNVITRALGHQADVQVDLFNETLHEQDVIVLCSDGLHGLVLDEEIRDIVRRHPPEDAVDVLIALANDRGGSDNITVIVALVESLDVVDEPITEEFDLEALRPAVALDAAPAPVPAPAAAAAPPERRLSILGAILALSLLVALVFVILVSLPDRTSTPIAPPSAVATTIATSAATVAATAPAATSAATTAATAAATVAATSVATAGPTAAPAATATAAP